jgi:hypothetical protein
MNKKFYLGVIVLAGVVGISIFNVGLQSKGKTEISVNTLLGNIEALSTCETSSDPTKNAGYCVAKYPSGGDV